MIELAAQTFGITVDLAYVKPKPLSKENLDSLLDRLTDTEFGLALRPEHIRLRQTDLAFDYELNAIFLGTNARVSCTAEKAFLSISGGRTRADAVLVAETAKRFLAAVVSSEEERGMFAVNVHAKAESASAKDEFLKQFRLSDLIVGPGAVGYVHVPEWPEDVRFAIEPSLGIPDSLFLSWNMTFRGILWFKRHEDITHVLEAVAAVYQLKFKPLFDS